MTIAKVSFVLSLLFVLAFADTPCRMAFEECKLAFRGFPTVIPTFGIGGAPDKVFTSRIVAKDSSMTVGILNTNKITPEFINGDGTIIKITKEGSPRLRRTHFKPFAKSFRKKFSGIGHQTFTGNQQSTATGRCVRVWFTHGQVLSSANPLRVRKNKVTFKRERGMCVVFRTE